MAQSCVQTNWLPLLMDIISVCINIKMTSVKSQFACDKGGSVSNGSCRPGCWNLLDLPTLHLLVSPFQKSIILFRFSRQHAASWNYLPQHYFHLFFRFFFSFSLWWDCGGDKLCRVWGWMLVFSVCQWICWRSQCWNVMPFAQLFIISVESCVAVFVKAVLPSTTLCAIHHIVVIKENVKHR